MAHPRHAQRSGSRAVLAGVIGGVLVVALVVLGIALWPRLSQMQTATPAAPGSTSGTPSGPTTGGTASSASAASSSASAESAAARASLKDCITRVRSTDEVLNQAAIGIRNWSIHVQAQIDADHGKISVETMDNKFKKTRAQGPDDIQRYQAALKNEQQVGSACGARPDANPIVAKKLTACQQRIAAQQPTLVTAAVAMHDWDHHLSDMARHADGKVPGAVAQQIWVRTYRAAPKHIDPYEKDVSKLDSAPACT